MQKLKFLLIVLISLFIIDVNAVESNASVGSNLTEYSCSAFQDDNMHISGDTYFGRCMQATCNSGNWQLRYYSTNSVSCSNGNLNPYTKITKSGCSNYQNKSCNSNRVYYCTSVTYFDCDRTANGSKYTTTTKRKPTTTTTTETTTTTSAPTLDNNTYLSSITLSTGGIEFKKDVRKYSIDVESNISFINVQAKAEVETSKVSVKGNSNLVAGINEITITVTAEDGSAGTYVIVVNKKSNVSNNAKLSSIIVEGHELSPEFDSDIFSYIVKTKEDYLNVEAETEDVNAYYGIEGVDNLKNNSVIKIVVTAADGQTMQEYSITVKKSGNNSLLVILLVIVLVVIVGAGGFYFYTKKKNGGEKEYEYE